MAATSIFTAFLETSPVVTPGLEKGVRGRPVTLSHYYVLTSRAVNRANAISFENFPAAFFCGSRDGPHLNDSRAHSQIRAGFARRRVSSGLTRESVSIAAETHLGPTPGWQ